MFVTEEVRFQTKANNVSFFRLKENLEKFVNDKKLNNGIIIIQSMHTTCSLFFEEMVHDVDEIGHESLHRDLIRGMNRIFPKQVLYDDYYDYPGKEHRKYNMENYACYQENPSILLNADAHLKASLMGASVTLIIINGSIQTGEFGDIYFVDWDSNRARERKCLISFYGE